MIYVINYHAVFLTKWVVMSFPYDFLNSPLIVLGLHQILQVSWHLHCGDGETVHICYGKLLPQMSPENPLNRSLCSLRKPSQMPGSYCEIFVTASRVLPVQLRNSCTHNTLHLPGCHKSWRTEGKLWNHIFLWIICWEGKHLRQKQRPFVFLTLLCADWSYESLDSPCCRFGSYQTQHPPLWRHL